jgi:hypothetical protein
MFKLIIIINLTIFLINRIQSSVLNSALNLVKSVTPSIDLQMNVDPFSFLKMNNTLNCFGIPINTIADSIELIFTHKTKAEDVRFYFYSRYQRQNVTVHATEDFNITNINFQVDRKTVFIIHGFLSSGQETWMQEMKNAFLKLV